LFCVNAPLDWKYQSERNDEAGIRWIEVRRSLRKLLNCDALDETLHAAEL
jgi:hypothetical protein